MKLAHTISVYTIYSFYRPPCSLSPLLLYLCYTNNVRACHAEEEKCILTAVRGNYLHLYCVVYERVAVWHCGRR